MIVGTILDTVVGLFFVFALAALLCTAVVQFVASVLHKRGKYLLRGLAGMLGDQAPAAAESGLRASLASLTRGTSLETPRYDRALKTGPNSAPTVPGTITSLNVMAHPLIDSVKSRNASGEAVGNPTELSPGTFATVILDLLVPRPEGALRTGDELRAAIDGLTDNPELRKRLSALLTTAAGQVDQFRQGLEAWFGEQMAQIGDAFTRWTRRWCTVVAIAVAAVAGIDALAIGNALYTQPIVRATIVAAATADGTSALCQSGTSAQDRLDCVRKELDSLGQAGLPIGWGGANNPGDAGGWLLKVIGVLITGLAARMGAPFWFNAIGRLTAARKAAEQAVQVS